MTCAIQSLPCQGGPVTPFQQALSICNQAKSLGSRAVQSTLYEQGKLFIDRTSQSINQNDKIQQNSDETASGHSRKEIEGFSTALVGIVFGANDEGRADSEAESMRSKRAALAAAYGNARTASAAGLKTLTTSLEGWLVGERSGPVRDLVKQALTAARRHPARAAAS